MKFERNEGKEYADIKRNEFIKYVDTAFRNVWLKQLAKRKKSFSEVSLDPDEFDYILSQRAVDFDMLADEAAGFSPTSWDEVMNSIENPKLDQILSQLTPEEQELLFYRLFHRLSYKEIGLRKRKCAKEVETRYDTILRKMRRWWRG